MDFCYSYISPERCISPSQRSSRLSWGKLNYAPIFMPHRARTEQNKKPFGGERQKPFALPHWGATNKTVALFPRHVFGERVCVSVMCVFFNQKPQIAATQKMTIDPPQRSREQNQTPRVTHRPGQTRTDLADRQGTERCPIHLTPVPPTKNKRTKPNWNVKKYVYEEEAQSEAYEMALTCCLWHAFDIWQIAHSADPIHVQQKNAKERAKLNRAFQMKWLNYVPSGGKWKIFGKTAKKLKIKKNKCAYRKKASLSLAR